MTKLTRDIHIKAPVEKVFEFLADPIRLSGTLPEFLEIENPKASVLGGHDYDWVYKDADTRYEGRLQVIEFLTNRLMVLKNTGGVEGLVTWNFDVSGDEEDHTHLMLEIDHNVSDQWLDANRQTIEAEIDALLQNIKARIESEVAYA